MECTKSSTGKVVELGDEARTDYSLAGSVRKALQPQQQPPSRNAKALEKIRPIFVRSLLRSRHTRLVFEEDTGLIELRMSSFVSDLCCLGVLTFLPRQSRLYSGRDIQESLRSMLSMKSTLTSFLVRLYFICCRSQR